VDTTVQEKAIAFPTDAKLAHRARERLVRLARHLAGAVQCPGWQLSLFLALHFPVIANRLPCYLL
jgi:hypothetical protein